MVLILIVSLLINLGYKSGERDSTADTKQLSESNQIHNEILTVSDSELQYIIENYDQFEHTNILEQLLQVLRRNQIIFFMLLIMEMTFTIFLLFLTWKKKENSILMLQQIYKDVNSKEAALIFYLVFILSFSINIVFYPLGLYSLISKKVQIFKIFSSFSMYTAILTVFIIYINM